MSAMVTIAAGGFDSLFAGNCAWNLDVFGAGRDFLKHPETLWRSLVTIAPAAQPLAEC
jgi:hypothetical protein